MSDVPSSSFSLKLAEAHRAFQPIYIFICVPELNLNK